MTTDQLLRELAADVTSAQTQLGAAVNAHVDSLIVDWLAGTQTLAAHSRDPDGRTCCCVCGASTQLTCVAPGWGGVWVCAVCDEATR